MRLKKKSYASKNPSASASKVFARTSTAFVLTLSETEFVAVEASPEFQQMPSAPQSVTTAEKACVQAESPEVLNLATKTPSQSPGNSYENPVLQMEAFVIAEQSESVTE